MEFSSCVGPKLFSRKISDSFTFSKNNLNETIRELHLHSEYVAAASN